jgi:hypothetical protein
LGAGGDVVASGTVELFKFHNSEPFAINDGQHRVNLQHASDTEKTCVLGLRFYKPGLGVPPIEKVISVI